MRWTDRARLTGIDVADRAVGVGGRDPGYITRAEEGQVGIGIQGDREAVIRVREGRVRQAGDRVDHGYGHAIDGGETSRHVADLVQRAGNLGAAPGAGVAYVRNDVGHALTAVGKREWSKDR